MATAYKPTALHRGRQSLVVWRQRIRFVAPIARGGRRFSAVRSVILLALVPAIAAADVSVGASVGAGAQGSSGYSALELRLDGSWPQARLGLGARGVWDDAVFRRSDWSSGWD